MWRPCLRCAICGQSSARNAARAYGALKSATDGGAENAASERIRALAEGFSNDLDKATSGELTEWRTEFIADGAEAAKSTGKLVELEKEGSGLEHRWD